MSEQSSMPALRGLEDEYEIRGELRGSGSTRHYIGRTKGEPAAEVAILVVPAAQNAENNAMSHFAADAQILGRSGHPTISRVLGGRWLGSEAYALVSERVIGETLDERLERGERFTNPRAALMLQEISAALDWAREAGVVHRGVSPETIFFENGSNRLRVMLTPTPVPMSGVPDACGDARTLGKLAWALLTGTPRAEGETRSLGEVAPNLATRVVEATDRMIACKDHGDAPDVGTYIGIVAAGDVMKQAEVELAAQKEEYDEQHAAALNACEIQRQEVEQNAAEQASILAGERVEFEQQMADERAALEAERAQMQAMLDERKDRLAAVRAELDQQRVELERRLTELEQYRAEVERLRDEALAAREEAKEAGAKATEAAAAHAAAVKAAAKAAEAARAAELKAASEMKAAASDDARPSDLREVSVEIPRVADMPPMPPVAAVPAIAVPELEPLKAKKLAKPPKPPKWSKIQPVDLEHTDNVELPSSGRPRWAIPAGVATLLIIVVALFIGMNRKNDTPPDKVRVGNSTVVPTPSAAQPAGIVPRGGFLTQSAGGALSPRFGATPGAAAGTAAATAPVDTAAARIAADSAARATAQPDTSEAVRARRAAAREAARNQAAREEAARADARRRAAQNETRPPGTPGFELQPEPRPANPATTTPPVTTPPASTPPVATPLPPVAPPVRPRPDTTVRPDTVIRPDTTMHRKR